MKVTNGREGARELLIQFNARGVEAAVGLVRDLYENPPEGYRGEKMSVARERGKRGRKVDCTVVLWHSQSQYPALPPEEFEQWWGRQGEYS